MDYAQQVGELLTGCQQAWSAMSPSEPRRKQVKEAMKQLVQLQDQLDELQEGTDARQLWEQQADGLIRKIQQKHLTDPSYQGEKKKTASTGQSSLFNRPRPATSSLYTSPFSTSRLASSTNSIPAPSSSVSASPLAAPPSNSSSSTSIAPSAPSDALQRLSLDVPRPQSNTDNDDNDAQKPQNQQQPPLRLPKSNSSLSMYSLPPDVIEAPTPQRSLSKMGGARQRDDTPSSSLSSSRLSLFGKKSTRGQAPASAQISFFNEDEDEHQVYACDAIVDHPLRIGIGYGSYICYSCTVFSNKGAPITVRKRYSDFVVLRQQLVKHYPHLKSSIPKLPPKKVVGKFTPTFVEQRRRELEYFFKYVVLHPTLGAGPVVKDWIAP